MVYGIWILSGGTQGFVTPPQNPGWGLPSGLYDPPGLVLAEINFMQVLQLNP